MKLIYTLLLVTIVSACGGGSDSEPEPIIEVPAIVAPKVATLIFPANNTECNTGEVINGDDTQTRVRFSWNISDDTDSYELNLKNLNNNNTSKINSITNELSVNIAKGTPFEWFVISKNKTNLTASSNKFKFYNQGSGIENYAPFPAEVISPLRGASIPNSPTVLLKWIGQDIDNDIVSYTILFDTLKPPAAVLGIQTETEISAAISTGQIYYWQIVTVDSKANSSQSEIFEFQVR